MEGMNNMFTYRLLENRNPKNGHLMSMSPSVKMSDCFQKYYMWSDMSSIVNICSSYRISNCRCSCLG